MPSLQSDVHMKLSEAGLIPKLIDFLRINDDNELLEIIGIHILLTNFLTKVLMCESV